MADVGELVVRVAMDNTSFQEGIKNLNRRIKLAVSEFKNATAGLSDHGKGLDALRAKSDMLSKQVDAQTKIVQMNRDRFNESKATLDENVKAQEKLKARIEQVKRAYEESIVTTGENSEETKALKEELDKLIAQYETNEEKIRNNVRTMENWEIKLNNAEAKLKTMEKELQSTNKEIELHSNNWYKLSERLDSAGAKIEQVSQKLSSVSKTLSTKVTAPIIGVGTLAAKSAIDFESAFAGVRKTVDATEEQFTELEKGIRAMSKEMPQSASDIAAVAEAAGQLGIKTENILGFTKTMIMLGDTTNLTSDQAATALARLANITRMPQSEFDKLGSSIVALGNNLATTESEIIEMGLRLAGTASQVGMTEDQILALAGAMSSVGINAEAGGSSMSRVMQKINTQVLSSGSKLQQFAKIAGMTVDEFSKTWKDKPQEAILAFVQGLDKVNKSGGDVTTTLKNLGITSTQEIDTLLRLSGAHETLADALEISSTAWEENKALAKEAEERYKTTASQLEIVKNHIKDAGITIGKMIVPHLVDFAEKIKDVVEWFANLDEGTQETIVKMAALIASLGPVTWVFSKITGGIGKVIKNMSIVSEAISVAKTGAEATTPEVATLAKVFGTLAGPAGIAIGAIGAAIAVGVLLWKNWDKIKEKAGELADWIKERWNNIKEWTSKTWENIKSTVSEKWNNLKDTVLGIGPAIKDGIVNTWENIKKGTVEKWENIKEGVSNAIKTVKDFLLSTFFNLPEPILNAFNTIKEGISTIFEGIRNILSGAWEVIKNIVLGAVLVIIDLVTLDFENFKNDIAGIWENIKSGFAQIWEGIKEIFSGALETIKGLLSLAWESIKEVAESVWTSIKEFFITTWTNIKEGAVKGWNSFKEGVINVITGTVDWIKRTWNNTVEWFSSLPGRLYDKGVEMFTSLKNGIGTMKDKVKSKAKEIGDEIINKIKELPGEMLSLGKDIVQGIIDGITEKIKGLKKKVTEVAETITGGIRKSLRISSPSKVMMEIGRDITEGLSIGIKNNLGTIERAIKLASNTLTDLDMPTKTAIAVQRVNSLSYENQKNPIKTSYRALSGRIESQVIPNTTINNNVNIYSPKALSPSEIRRQTETTLRRLAFEF